MSSRIIDYSKWDTLKYSSSSSSEEDDEKARATIAHLGDLLLSSSQRTSSSSPLWNGLVLHHKDVFVSHVLPKLNTTDRCFFSMVGRESRGVLEYAGVNVSKLCWNVHECSSISTLELVWNHMLWGEKFEDGTVRDQAWFCEQVAATNKLEFLKWAREVKQCEWDEDTIKMAAFTGNLEMLKYCFSNECPYDEERSCEQAAIEGHLDCLRFLFDKVKPSRDTEKDVVTQAACGGHVEILKYFVEERKIWDDLKLDCVATAALHGKLDCIKYLFGESITQHSSNTFLLSSKECTHDACFVLEAKSDSTTRNDEDSSAEAKSCFVSENTRGRCLRKRRRSIVLLQITSSMAALMSNISEEKVFAASSSPEDVPKEYAEKLRSACELLLKSIEYERAHPSASVSERFAAADPAKQAVKEYIQTWQGRPETRDLETSVITGEVLRELARYYKKNGSQVALDAELRDDVVVPKLNEVLNMLPAKAPTLAERVLGISTNSSNKAN
ncbi:unnamed protein product [Bathycoccus prasinos]